MSSVLYAAEVSRESRGQRGRVSSLVPCRRCTRRSRSAGCRSAKRRLRYSIYCKADQFQRQQCDISVWSRRANPTVPPLFQGYQLAEYSGHPLTYPLIMCRIWASKTGMWSSRLHCWTLLMARMTRDFVITDHRSSDHALMV